MSVKMQPPPRKGKVSTVLKNTHNEQLVKLQMKHQQDSDFLDDIRNFSKMRAIIEKDYAQSLLKLATSHLQKKGPTCPEGKPEDGESYNTVYAVWKSLLDETEKIARARLAATEVYQQQVSEGAKSLRLYKLQVAKKCFENLKKMHEEIQTCVTEIDKSKKLYFEEEHMAHDARDKAHDADEKLKRKKGRIFQSISSLQKNSAKFSFRREACDIQATKARNDYVLALLAANAHQSKFYENDLPELVQYIDCDIYDKVKEYILLIARTELLTCAACQSSFNIVQEQANKATRQYTMECFFRDNPVLSQPLLYEFEPCDNDQINTLCIEHNAALCLSKEAKRWAACVTKEVRVIRDSKSELRKLLAQIGDKPPYHLQSDQIGPQAELEARIDELRQIIRKAQTSKKKAEARLEAMVEAGVNIEDWVKTSETESISDAPVENFSRSGTVKSRASQRSFESEVFEGSVEVNDAPYYDSDSAEPISATAESYNEPVYERDLTSAIDVVAAVQEAWDAAAETDDIDEPELEAVQSSIVNGEVATSAAPGQKCLALFSYEATNSDELSFVEQEELELINEGDGDGWVMARNYRGEEGYIPQNYVEVQEVPSSGTSSRPPLTSFSSVDYTMPDEDAAPTDSEPPTAVTANGTSEAQRPTELSYEERISTSKPFISNIGIACCQALYDYEATCDEELTFYEGQIIKILRRVVCDVDDGWWEGELDGQIGLFPSLVVEELKENGEPITPMTPMSPPNAPPPPAFTPPEAELPTLEQQLALLPPATVTLTQPTPETENPDGTQPKAAEEANKYTPLVSSPESPTKTVATTLKEATIEVTQDEVSSEKTSPSQETDECPTVVVTHQNTGDTPTSDEEPPEIKEDSTATKVDCEKKDEKEAEEKSKEPEISSSAVVEEPKVVPAAEDTAAAFGESQANPDSFECNFDDHFANFADMPVDPKAGEQIGMETGSDGSKSSFEESKSAETTG
ncbi:hypothetical protein JTE90_021915 [Oedothorax gibbosus]|uniref:F-BAR and double SH3 domains protein 2 n=1 Tax=Oedothorax gibbosus TaxID=931172 RepID=A0AAV6VUN5_9ARAC|nr:hypothetical protein JTE90_021915 [Oedothorax gibbosus]